MKNKLASSVNSYKKILKRKIIRISKEINGLIGEIVNNEIIPCYNNGYNFKYLFVKEYKDRPKKGHINQRYALLLILNIEKT